MRIPILKQEAQEFIAKYLGDLSKAIVTVAFASHFFKEFPTLLRFSCLGLAFTFFVVGVILIERKGE